MAHTHAIHVAIALLCSLIPSLPDLLIHVCTEKIGGTGDKATREPYFVKECKRQLLLYLLDERVFSIL